MNKELLQQAIDTINYYALVCGEDDQDTPAKQTIKALEGEIAKPEPVPVAWRSWHDTYGVGYWDTFDEAELNCAEDAVPEPLFTKEQL